MEVVGAPGERRGVWVVIAAGRGRFVRWLVVWLLLYGAGSAVYNATFERTRPVLVGQMQARPAAWLLGLTLPGATVRSSPDGVQSGRVELRIMRGCDGVEAWLLMATAMVAFPVPWRRRLAGIGLGSLLVLGLNQVRIVSLFHLVRHRPEWFDVAHGLVWQSVMVVAAALLVLVWVERTPGAEATPVLPENKG
jgi:exosortase/archaeosortase family protein